jgi:hypothetical protein
VIGTVQSIVAIGTDTSIASTFNDVRFEALGFAAIALGYCSLYVGEHLFPASLAKIILLSSILAFCIGGGLSWVAPRHVILPVVAFTAAALSRQLQRVPIPLLWLAGTAAPLLIAGLLFGSLFSGQGLFPWFVWLGLSISCRVLQLIVQVFGKFVFVESFA